MHRKPTAKSVLIKSVSGSLEGLLELHPSAEVLGCAVICHPHPIQGGTMQNKVVHILSRTFVAQQFVSLRFNFRGVGNSSGEFDHGRGEVQDVLAATAWMRHHFEGLPVWLAGFSFGGAMAIQAAVNAQASGLICIAPATSRFAHSLHQLPTCPWLFVQGDKDELVDIDETIGYINCLPPGPQLVMFRDGGHFFHGRLIELRDTVGEFIAGNLAA